MIFALACAVADNHKFMFRLPWTISASSRWCCKEAFISLCRFSQVRMWGSFKHLGQIRQNPLEGGKCVSMSQYNLSLYIHYLEPCSGPDGGGLEKWAGLDLSPEKGLMTHVWTNGSLWSYLLIQPHYFTSIKYVCPDLSLFTLLPTLMQVNRLLIRSGAWGFQTFCVIGHSWHSEANIKEKLSTAISVNGSSWVHDHVEKLHFM